MTEKKPVTLAAHLDLTGGTWSVASVDTASLVDPLVQSQPLDLTPWTDGSIDERVSFLRHRIAGILQRGADRLWGRQQKAQRFVLHFLCHDTKDSHEVVSAVAQHFCTWMLKPPVICLRISPNGPVNPIAANTTYDDLESIAAALQELRTQSAQPNLWELAPPRSNR